MDISALEYKSLTADKLQSQRDIPTSDEGKQCVVKWADKVDMMPVPSMREVRVHELKAKPSYALSLVEVGKGFGVIAETILVKHGLRQEEAPEKVDLLADSEQYTAKRCGTRRELEMLWLADHRRELEKYRGEWVGLQGYNLVAHGKNLDDVVNQLRACGIKTPFTLFVPEKKKGIFMGL